MDRLTKKIKHGVVLVEFEESVVVVHYDIETVRFIFACDEEPRACYEHSA